MKPANNSIPVYSREASELNKLVIKLKKEILKENITSFTTEEVDAATIPALTTLRQLKPRK